MDKTTRKPGTEDLVAHARFLRRLAASLVPDSHVADDLVQDTYAAALAAERLSLSHPRAWLAGIARNLARLHFRREGRRRSHEQRLLPAHAAVDPAETASRIEVEQRLLGAVADLSEPYRSALYARYFDGLTAAAIGRNFGVPASTVRTWVQRGIEHLRRRLDRDHGGDRQAWLVPLLVLARSPTRRGAVASPVLAGGVVIMAGKKAWMAGIAVLLLLLGTVAILPSGFGSRPPPRPAPAPELERADEPAANPGVAETERPTVAAARDAEIPSGDPERASVLVTVTDEDGNPLPGIRVTALPEATMADSSTWGRGETGPEGNCRLDDLLPGRLGVRAGSGNYARSVRVNVEAGRAVPVVLRMAAGATTVSGIVRRVNGDPLAGTKISLTQRDDEGSGFYHATADAGGRYRIEGVKGGEYSAQVYVPGVIPFLTPLSVPKSGHLERDFVFGRVLLSGRITDATTGHSVVGAQVVFLMRGGIYRRGESDANGEYGVEDIRPGASGRLSIRAEGYVPRLEFGVEVPAEGTTLDFELVPAARLTLLVSKAGGEPYHGPLTLTTLPLPASPGRSNAKSVELETDEQGRVVYEGVSPGRYYATIRARPQAEGEATLEIDLGPGGTEASVILR